MYQQPNHSLVSMQLVREAYGMDLDWFGRLVTMLRRTRLWGSASSITSPSRPSSSGSTSSRGSSSQIGWVHILFFIKLNGLKIDYNILRHLSRHSRPKSMYNLSIQLKLFDFALHFLWGGGCRPPPLRYASLDIYSITKYNFIKNRCDSVNLFIIPGGDRVGLNCANRLQLNEYTVCFYGLRNLFSYLIRCSGRAPRKRNTKGVLL